MSENRPPDQRRSCRRGHWGPEPLHSSRRQEKNYDRGPKMLTREVESKLQSQIFGRRRKISCYPPKYQSCVVFSAEKIASEVCKKRKIQTNFTKY